MIKYIKIQNNANIDYKENVILKSIWNSVKILIFAILTKAI